MARIKKKNEEEVLVFLYDDIIVNPTQTSWWVLLVTACDIFKLLAYWTTKVNVPCLFERENILLFLSAILMKEIEIWKEMAI